MPVVLRCPYSNLSEARARLEQLTDALTPYDGRESLRWDSVSWGEGPLERW